MPARPQPRVDKPGAHLGAEHHPDGLREGAQPGVECAQAAAVLVVQRHAEQHSEERHRHEDRPALVVRKGGRPSSRMATHRLGSRSSYDHHGAPAGRRPTHDGAQDFGASPAVAGTLGDPVHEAAQADPGQHEARHVEAARLRGGTCSRKIRPEDAAPRHRSAG